MTNGKLESKKKRTWNDVYNKKDGAFKCPECNCSHFNTTRTEQLKGSVRRRKKCRNCGYNMSTTERKN